MNGAWEHDAPAAITAAIKSLAEAINAAAMAESSFNDLSGLFAAVHELAPEHSTIRAIARVGKYLADDRGNAHDCERESLEAQLSSLRMSLQMLCNAGQAIGNNKVFLKE